MITPPTLLRSELAHQLDFVDTSRPNAGARIAGILDGLQCLDSHIDPYIWRIVNPCTCGDRYGAHYTAPGDTHCGVPGCGCKEFKES